MNKGVEYVLTNVMSMSLAGVDGYIVSVEVDVHNGMPSWEIVGLPGVSIREAKERVRTAIKNSGFEICSRNIVVNLAPAYTRKEGSSFDLPIAIGILSDLSYVKKENIHKYVFIGELSLDGRLNKVSGILPMCAEAKRFGIKNVIVPFDNRVEAGVVKGINVYPAKSLEEVVSHLNDDKMIDAFSTDVLSMKMETSEEEIDFSDVKGQESVKRALEIGVAGAHNMLMIGSPGAGKTMLSKRLPTIMPDLSFEEMIEVTKIHSIAGNLSDKIPLVMKRPFRAPHHTSTTISLTGGGTIPKPGEMSLAHLGVLFLDEFSEFHRNTLEALRAPIEDGVIRLSRSNFAYTYPCRFMLVASMNPCPCGNYGSSHKTCICTPYQRENYMKKVSGPILDRMDLEIEVTPVNYEKLQTNEKRESSKEIKERIECARKIQLERYQKLKIYTNSELTSSMLSEFCGLKNDAKNLLEKVFTDFGLSARAYEKVIKVSRTIADLEESKEIELKHVAEAIQYRSLDRKYFHGKEDLYGY